MKSWKTTLMGIIMIIIAIGTVISAFIDNDPNTNPDWAVIAATIIGGIRLIVSGENTFTGIDNFKKK